MPNSIVTMASLDATASARPSVVPINVNDIPCRITSVTMLLCEAPSAERTPISFVRSATLPDKTP